MRYLIWAGGAGLVICILALLPAFVPPVADTLNRQGVKWALADRPETAARLFSYLNRFGNAPAQNNLGVLYQRGMGVDRDEQRAHVLFSQAADQDLVQARFNLVMTSPNAFDQPKREIRRDIDALEANIAEGDVHSRAFLAKRLRFKNRSEYVEDLARYRRELLADAAASGDPEYLALYGSVLERQAFEEDDVGLMLAAVAAYKAAYEGGNMRAAEQLGALRRLPSDKGQDRVKSALGRPAIEWTLIAAQAGIVSARCRYGIRRFRNLSRAKVPPKNPSRFVENAQAFAVQGLSIPMRQIISYLEECAEGKHAPRSANPPFGQEALYLRKSRISRRSLANGPFWAKVILGKAYAIGYEVPKDVQKARAYFDLLNKEERNTDVVKGWLSALR